MQYHSHASYTNGTADCITAWDRMTGNYSHVPAGSSLTQAELDVRASYACTARINGIDNLALGSLILAVVTLMGAVALLLWPRSAE